MQIIPMELMLWALIWTILIYNVVIFLIWISKKVYDFYKPLKMGEVDRIISRDKSRCRHVDSSGKRCEKESQHLRKLGSIFDERLSQWVVLCVRHTESSYSKEEIAKILQKNK